MNYKYHHVCEMFPAHTEEEQVALTEDIRANGLRRPVLRFGGKIIDGKGRLAACEHAGVKPYFQDYHPKATAHDDIERELMTVAVSENLHRRHLSASQRGLLAAEIAKSLGKSQEKFTANLQYAATAMGVSQRTAFDAAAVVESGSEALQEAVKSGDVTVSDAAQIVDEPKVVQNAAVKAVRAKKSPTVKKAVAKKKAEEKTDDEKPDEPKPVLDHFKVPVPDDLRDVFSQGEEFRSLMAAVSDCKSRATALAATPGGGWLDVQEIERLLTDARSALRFGQPYTECPKCRRKPVKKCTACKGTGWIHESMYKSSASDEDKAWVAEGRA